MTLLHRRQKPTSKGSRSGRLNQTRFWQSDNRWRDIHTCVLCFYNHLKLYRLYRLFPTHLTRQTRIRMRGDYRQNERIQLCNCVVSFYCCNMPLYYYVSSSFGNIVFRQYHRCFATPSFGSFVIRHDSQ